MHEFLILCKNHSSNKSQTNILNFFSKIFHLEISHLNMAGDAEQTDSSGKYTFGGGAATAKKYWPTILKSIEVILCILCIGLIDDPAQNSRIRVFVSQRTVALCYVTFGSFLIYSIVFLIGKLIRDE